MNTILPTPVQSEQFVAQMERTHKKVYNLAYRLSMNKQDAEDLTQEAFFRAYRSFADYEGDRPFENWILRIVTRLFLDLKRARRRRVQTSSYDAPKRALGSDDQLYIEPADPNSNTESLLFEGTLSEELQDAISQLKPEHRTLVILADVEQMPYGEIAEMLNVPIGTVRSRLHRSHKKLRSILESSKSDRFMGQSNFLAAGY